MNNSGYINIEIGGKPRGLKFGLNAWIEFNKLTGLDVSDLQDAFIGIKGMGSIRALVYAGLKCVCDIKGEALDFNEAQVGEWLDEMSQESIAEIINAVMDSQLLGVKLNEQGVKKKVKK